MVSSVILVHRRKIMKDRILIILSILIVIAVIVIFAFVNNPDIGNENHGDNQKEFPNVQKLDLNNNNLSSVTIDNGLLLEKSKVECSGEICFIDIIARNNTSLNIDMSNYRISFLDVTGEEIYWYSGESIGNISANSEVNFILEIPKGLNNIQEIFYTK